jgi:hypothetical protein
LERAKKGSSALRARVCSIVLWITERAWGVGRKLVCKVNGARYGRRSSPKKTHGAAWWGCRGNSKAWQMRVDR